MGRDRERKDNRHQSSARYEAARRLDLVEERKTFVGLGDRKGSFNAQSERQTRDLVSGVSRMKRYLDFLLGSFYSGSLHEMEPKLKTVLRIGVFELLFSATPDHAAINEAVELSKQRVRVGASRLTNGILRSILRAKDALPVPDSGSVAHRLAILHSHPDWMVQMWIEQFGEEQTTALLQHNNARPTFGVHIVQDQEDVLKALQEADVSFTKSPFIPGFIRTHSIQPFLRGGFLDSGSVRVQDEAAALVVLALNPKSGEKILDMCAAPGGKAVFAALLSNDEALITASDIHGRRLRLIDDACNQFSLHNISLKKADGTNPPREWMGQYDAVLLDAPCTGFGVLSKRADMRWHRSESDLAELVELQSRLIDGAAQCVKPGGRLIYSTCTMEPKENREQVEAFLNRNPSFSLEPVSDHIQSSLKDEQGCYVSLPFKHGMDGAYAACLRKNS